jgi:hypothetical protein
MLGLMRDPNVPTDLRLEMAKAAAPFIHLRQRDQRREGSKASAAASSSRVIGSQQGGAGLTIRRGPLAANTSQRKMEGELIGALVEDQGARELSPVDYLVSVMNDPDAAPRDRVKAARVAAPYLHARPEIDDMPIVIEDPFGFPVDPVLAKEICEDQQRARALRRPLTLQEGIDVYGQGKPFKPQSPEYQELTGQIDKRLKEIDCPASYGRGEEREDKARLADLSPKSNGQARKNPLTAEEVAERDHLQFRLSVYAASPAWEAHVRLGFLLHLRDHRTLTPAEASELDELRSRYHEKHAKKYQLDLSEATEIFPSNMPIYGSKRETTSERPNGADSDSIAPSNAGSKAR